MGKGKNGGKGSREGRTRGRKEKGREGKKGNGKGILAIPILVCFRRRCTTPHRDFLGLVAPRKYLYVLLTYLFRRCD